MEIRMLSKKKIIAGNLISEICVFNLAGYLQKVLIEGKTKDLPVVINLHGGPGMPVPFCVGCRGMFPEFTGKYIMVYWDQLGCGCNTDERAKNLSVSDYVDMTIDLVREIKKMFPENKIFLFAISWGTVLSSLALEREPKLVDGVLAWGQFVREAWLNSEVIQELKNHKIPPKKLERFRELTPEHFDADGLKFMYKVISKYTNGYTDRRFKSMPKARLLKGYITSPDYRLRDLKTFLSNDAMLNISIYKELLLLDEIPILERVKIPYMILSGESDIICASKSSLSQLMKSKNENLSIVELKNSGHIPSLAAFQQTGEYLRKLVEI